MFRKRREAAEGVGYGEVTSLLASEYAQRSCGNRY
jgi:hypothetical protein